MVVVVAAAMMMRGWGMGRWCSWWMVVEGGGEVVEGGGEVVEVEEGVVEGVRLVVRQRT